MTLATGTRHVEILHERKVAARRLGRHVEHDSRSRHFETAHASASLVSAAWKRHGDPFDQGDVGSCTGNAMMGVCMTEPFFVPGRILTGKDALDCYTAATRIDHIKGVYPPDDTGSSGLAVAKVAQRRGLIRNYRHAFSLLGALASLGRGPIIIGIDWYEGFDVPRGPHAELVIDGESRGGHEVELSEIDISKRLVRGPNSWGTSWGDDGYFTMSFDTLGTLLARKGDVTVPQL